jgi:hypothetical protein
MNDTDYRRARKKKDFQVKKAERESAKRIKRDREFARQGTESPSAVCYRQVVGRYEQS